MPFARASELDRLLDCHGSAWLPRSPDRPIEAGEWGRAFHHWKATGEARGESGYPNHGPLIARRAEGVDREALWPATGTHEVGVGLCCATGTAATFTSADPAAVDRWKAALPDSFVCGTLDFSDELVEVPWVDDLKTGRFPPSPRSAQVMFYVLVAHRTHYPVPDAAWASITHWPRYPVGRGPARDWALIPRSELDAFELVLRRLHRDVQRFRGSPVPDARVLNPGPACTYCPSREHCPATNPEAG